MVIQSIGNEGNKCSTLDHLLLDSEKDKNGYHLCTMLANNIEDVCNGYRVTYPAGFYLHLYSLDDQEFTCDLMAVDSITGEVYSLADKKIYYYNSDTDKYSPIPSFFSYPYSGLKNGKYYIEYLYRTPYGFTHAENKNIRLAVFVKGHDGQKIRMICDKEEMFFGTPAVPGNFTPGDAVNSLSVEVCTDAVISVGNYVERPYWQSLYLRENNVGPSQIYSYTDSWAQVEGGISPDSSFGLDDNGNQISAYIWTKMVDAKTEYGYRLTTQTPAGKEDDPVLYPGWRGQHDSWESFGLDYKTDKPKTNLAIKGLFKYIDPDGPEAAALEADGYKKVDYASPKQLERFEYHTSTFYDYDYNKAPIYMFPFTEQILQAGGFTNGYGYRQTN